MRVSTESLLGRTAIGADGLALGEVVGFFVDTDRWGVEIVRLKLRKEVAEQLGVARSVFHGASLDVPVRFVQSVGDAVVLSVGASGLRSLAADVDASAPVPTH